jgi:hypothetical protein
MAFLHAHDVVHGDLTGGASLRARLISDYSCMCAGHSCGRNCPLTSHG